MAVWAESDQARDVCEVALAVVSAPSDQAPLLCEVVPVVLVGPKEQEPSSNRAIQRRSRCDRSVLLPWRVCRDTRPAFSYSTHDAANRNCRYCRSDTFPSQGSPDAGRHGDICASKQPDVPAWLH